MGAEPTSPYAQVEQLTNLLKNRVNSQWNPSVHGRLEAKTIENIEKQTIRRLYWDNKVPGTRAGTRAAAAPSLVPQDPWMRAKSTAPSPAKQGGQSGTMMDLDA